MGIALGLKSPLRGSLSGPSFRSMPLSPRWITPWSVRVNENADADSNTMEPVVSVGYFEDAEAFISGNPDFPGERAGRNDSDQDNFIKGDGWDNFFRLRFNYLLPIGNGRDQIIATYKIKLTNTG
jgi:hypothetical protein